jgi:hypothetical protein
MNSGGAYRLIDWFVFFFFFFTSSSKRSVSSRYSLGWHSYKIWSWDTTWRFCPGSPLWSKLSPPSCLLWSRLASKSSWLLPCLICATNTRLIFWRVPTLLSFTLLLCYGTLTPSLFSKEYHRWRYLSRWMNRGLLGPHRQFGEGTIYRPIVYFTPIGALLPILFYLMTKRFLNSWLVSLRDNNVAQKASTMFSSYSSLQYKYFHTIISILCFV